MVSAHLTNRRDSSRLLKGLIGQNSCTRRFCPANTSLPLPLLLLLLLPRAPGASIYDLGRRFVDEVASSNIFLRFKDDPWTRRDASAPAPACGASAKVSAPQGTPRHMPPSALVVHIQDFQYGFESYSFPKPSWGEREKRGEGADQAFYPSFDHDATSEGENGRAAGKRRYRHRHLLLERFSKVGISASARPSLEKERFFFAPRFASNSVLPRGHRGQSPQRLISDGVHRKVSHSLARKGERERLLQQELAKEEDEERKRSQDVGTGPQVGE